MKSRIAISVLAAAAMIPAGANVSIATTEFCDLPVEDRPPITEPVELCGTTQLSGDSAGVIRVTLPEAATIASSIGDGGGVEIDGTGSFVGVALIEDPPSVASRGFVAAKTPVENGGSTLIGLGLAPDCSPCSLPAGTYRLYLLTTSSQTEVTLHLEGRTGSVALTPARSTPFKAAEFTRQLDLGHNLVGMTSGDTFELSSPGFLYRGIKLTGVDVTGTGVFSCDVEPLPAYLPACVRDDSVDGGAVWVGQRQDPSVTSYSLVEPGDYSQGAWLVSPVPPSRVDSVGVWITFN